MGNCNFKQDFDNDTLAALTKSNFMYQYCIGKGGFGKVWKVERKKTKQNYAMKEMSKARILSKRSLKSVMNERQILTQLHNPFIVNMYYAFQDRENLYLVMDYLSGGDLRYHICKHRRFTEEQTRFFIACLIAGLEYVHNKQIIHRDIKPENLVFDEDGYLRITDFGIARMWRPENSQDTSGTPGYMAPEVMCRQNHGIQVDYFAVGVMAFECMFGRRPYVGKSRQEIRDHILSKQIQIKKNEVPKGWSLEAADFINKMIQRKPINRLGKNGPAEVKAHPWLKDFPWNDLWSKKIQAPFIPPTQDNFDQKNINEEWKDLEDEEFQQHLLSLRRNSVQSQFNGYYYDYQLAAMNLTPGLMSQSEITQYIQTQTQGQPPVPIQQQPIVAARVQKEPHFIQPQIQYPKSEVLSPKNGRLPLQFSQLPSHPQRLQSALIKKPQTAQPIQMSEVQRETGSQLESSSFYHQRKGSSGALARLTPQQQQFLSLQLQNLQVQQQQMIQLQKANESISNPDKQSSLYKSKRASSRSGTTTVKNASLLPNGRPWSSSINASTHASAQAYHSSGQQSIQQVPTSSQLNHSSLLLRKTSSQAYSSNQPSSGYHHGHSHSVSVQQHLPPPSIHHNNYMDNHHHQNHSQQQPAPARMVRTQLGNFIGQSHHQHHSSMSSNHHMSQ